MEELGWLDPRTEHRLPHSNGAQRVSEELWPRRGPDDKWRTVAGEPVAKADLRARFNYHGRDKRRASPYGGWRDKQAQIAGKSTSVQLEDGSWKRDSHAEDARCGSTRMERHTAAEAANGGHREASRGPGSWGSCKAVGEMLGRAGVDPETGEAFPAGSCLPHLEDIAATDPNEGPFTFDNGPTDLPVLTTSAEGHRQWIETSESVGQRDRVARDWLAHFGGPHRLSSLPVTPNVRGSQVIPQP